MGLGSQLELLHAYWAREWIFLFVHYYYMHNRGELSHCPHLSFEVVLPFLCLQSFKAAIAV